MSELSVATLPAELVSGAMPVEADQHAPPAAWWALGILCAVTLLRWIDQVVLVVGTESMRRSLGLTDTQLGMIQGLGIYLAAGIGAIPLGWLADRFDRLKVLALCILAWSAATVWRAYVSSFGDLMSSTIGMAVADAALMPVSYALMPLLFRGRQLARANLILYGASALGYSIAMVFAGGMFRTLQAHQAELPHFLRGMEPWRSVSFIVGCVGPLSALLVLGIRTPSRPRRNPNFMPRVPKEPRASLRDHLALHWRALAGIYGSALLVSIGIGPLLVWVGPAVARRFALDPSVVGAEVGTLFLLATILGMAISALLEWIFGRKLGAMVSVRSAPALMLLCLFPLAWLGVAGTRTSLYGCVFLILLTLVSYNASMPSTFQKVVPSSLRARMTALGLAVLLVANAGGPLLVGCISDWLGSPNALLASMALVGLPTTALGALLLWWAQPHVESTLAHCEEVDDRAEL